MPSWRGRYEALAKDLERLDRAIERFCRECEALAIRAKGDIRGEASRSVSMDNCKICLAVQLWNAAIHAKG